MSSTNIYSVSKEVNKVETSKKLLLFAIIFCTAITAAAVVAIFYLRDATALAYLIPAAFGLLSTAYGFYFWKAKNENLQKYKQKDQDVASEISQEPETDPNIEQINNL